VVRPAKDWPYCEACCCAATAATRSPYVTAAQWRHLSHLSMQSVASRGPGYKSCMVFRCDLLDGVIAEEMLKALQPAELELALAALNEY
jgi:hypothetical protein